MNLEQRIEALEKAIGAEEWPDVEISMYVKDCSLAGIGKPERLSMVTKSGTPTRPGRTYRRQEAETETVFRERIRIEEKLRGNENA